MPQFSSFYNITLSFKTGSRLSLFSLPEGQGSFDATAAQHHYQGILSWVFVALLDLLNLIRMRRQTLQLQVRILQDKRSK